MIIYSSSSIFTKEKNLTKIIITNNKTCILYVKSDSSTMLDRLFGDGGFFGAGAWWIIVLFFLFLAFGDSWVDIDIMAWIPFLIILLILCSCGGCLD